MSLPKSFENLVKSFEIFPGVGEKTAERFVYSLLNKDVDEVENLSESMLLFKKNIRFCEKCGCLSDFDKCEICSDNSRNKSIICVVEDSKSVFSFEKTGKFNGLYHVLNGLISPIDNKNPEDLNIYSLINERINDEVEEVIIAINPSVEGEITSLYLQKILENKKVKVSRLSYGIPMGAEIDYLDEITLDRALSDRKKIS